MKELLKQFILRNKKAVVAVISSVILSLLAGAVGMSQPEFKAAVCGLPETKAEAEIQPAILGPAPKPLEEK